MRRKWMVILGVVAVVAVVVAVSLVKMRGQGAGEGVEVQVEPAARRQVIQTVTATGKVQPMTQVNISADVSAKITRLEVAEGDWVEKGQFLLQLDSERYQAAVESAQANLRAAQANVNLARENMVKAEKDLERMRQLFDSKLESQSVLDSVYAVAEVEKARHQSARDQTEQARASLKQALDDLSKTTIYAPMAGTVSTLNKEVGEIALGSQFQEDVILVISNLQGMEARVDVDENDIVTVSLGDRAEIEVDAFPDRKFGGEVTEIASSATITGTGSTDQKTEFEVKVAFIDAGSALRPGMTASAEIVTEVRAAALSVPIQCVAVRTLEQIGAGAAAVADGPGPADPAAAGAPRFSPDSDGFLQFVWVVEGDTARARQVTTGIQGETHIEILEGLEEGEQVVVGSYRAISRDLRDGSKIRLSDAESTRG